MPPKEVEEGKTEARPARGRYVQMLVASAGRLEIHHTVVEVCIARNHNTDKKVSREVRDGLK